MGAEIYTCTATGKNYRDAYRNAQREAEYEFGHQEGYSGAINSTTECQLIKGSLERIVAAAERRAATYERTSKTHPDKYSREDLAYRAAELRDTIDRARNAMTPEQVAFAKLYLTEEPPKWGANAVEVEYPVAVAAPKARRGSTAELAFALLARSPDAILPTKEIARRVGKSPVATNRYLNKLAESGHVVKVARGKWQVARATGAPQGERTFAFIALCPC